MAYRRGQSAASTELSSTSAAALESWLPILTATYWPGTARRTIITTSYICFLLAVSCRLDTVTLLLVSKQLVSQQRADLAGLLGWLRVLYGKMAGRILQMRSAAASQPTFVRVGPPWPFLLPVHAPALQINYLQNEVLCVNRHATRHDYKAASVQAASYLVFDAYDQGPQTAVGRDCPAGMPRRYSGCWVLRRR